MIIQLSEIGTIILYASSILFSMIVLRYAQKYDSRVLLWIVIIFLGCIIGFRYEVGKDFGNYANAYNLITAQASLAEAHRWYTIEESYFILSFFSKIIGGTSQTVFLFYGFFTTVFYLFGIWYFRKEIRMEWAVLSYSILFFGSFNTIRQYLAMAIVFWGFRFIIEKKAIKYFLCVLVAILFHQSAFVAIIAYFYGTRKSFTGGLVRKFNYLLPFLLVVGTDEILSFLQKYANSRFENYSANIHFGTGFFIQIAILWLFIRSSNQGDNSLLVDENKHFFVKQILILSTILCILDYTLGDASRIRNYFSTIEMVVFGSLPSVIFRNNTRSELPFVTYADIFMVGYFFLFVFMGFINRDPWIYPYSFRLSL